MNVYRQELRMMRTSCLLWCLVLSGLVLMFLSIYPAFKNDIATSQQLLERFPDAVRAMLGLSLSSFFTFLGFYSYMFSYLTLAGAIQGMNVGLSLLSKEDSAKTTDFLLTKPISRTKIFFAKLCSGVTILAITSVVFTFSVIGCAAVVGAGGYSLTALLLLNGAFFTTQLCFMAIGLLLSQVVPRVKSVISISLGVTFGFFAISLLGSLMRDEKFRYLTPFKFFDYLHIIQDGSYRPDSLALALGTITTASAVSYLLYLKRDVRAAA